MKKTAILLCMLGACVSQSYAESIEFTNQKYELTYVDITSSGCDLGFGAQLQQDITLDRLTALVDVNYDTGLAMGNAKMSVENKSITDDTLPPLGLAGTYAFADFHQPFISMVINGNDYLVYGVSYMTTGSTESEWINNGVAILSFHNSKNPNVACPVASAYLH